MRRGDLGAEHARQQRDQRENAHLGEQLQADGNADAVRGGHGDRRSGVLDAIPQRGDGHEGEQHDRRDAEREPPAESPERGQASRPHADPDERAVSANQDVAHEEVDDVGHEAAHERRRRAPMRLEERLGRQEREGQREAGRLTEQVQLHARHDRRRDAHGREREGDREGGAHERRPEQQRGLEARHVPSPRASRLSGAEGRHADGDDHRGEPDGPAHARPGEIVDRHAPDDRRVDERHRHEPELRERNGKRELHQGAQLRERCSGRVQGGRADSTTAMLSRRDYRAASSSPAAPMPPPMHMVTMAYLPPRRRSSWSAVAVSFAPVHPSG